MKNRELMEQCLEKAEPVLQAYVDAALGVKDLKSINAGCRTELWDILKAVILYANEVEHKYAPAGIETEKDVLNAVLSGKMMIKQGLDLMNLFLAVRKAE